jgi:hypothetical protein
MKLKVHRSLAPTKWQGEGAKYLEWSVKEHLIAGKQKINTALTEVGGERIVDTFR